MVARQRVDVLALNYAVRWRSALRRSAGASRVIKAYLGA